MAIKITPADKAFSLCIRERAHWRCERCGRVTPDDKRMGLHCSHWQGRGSWSTRLHPLNAFAHCYGCHSHFEQHPVLFADWVVARLGQDIADRISALSNRPGYSVKRQVPAIAKFYREQHKAMLVKRAEGVGGWLSFDICPLVPDIEVLQVA